MSASKDRAQTILSLIKEKYSVPELIERQSPKVDKPFPPPIRTSRKISQTTLENYWKILLKHTNADENDKNIIADDQTCRQPETYQHNIENFIGTVKLPVGIIGPLRVNGVFAQDDYYVSLATADATLVASHGRGAKLINACGGCTTSILNTGLSRTPAFAFKTITEAGLFTEWVNENFDTLKKIAEETTWFGQLVDLRTHMELDVQVSISQYSD